MGVEEHPRRPHVAVIGAGVTGLAAAHRLCELSRAQRRAIRLSVFEASHRVGGVFGTRCVGDYRVETGADSFITDKPWALDLCRRLGLEDQLIPVDENHRRALILHRGRPVATPEGFQLMAPTRLGPLFLSPLLSWPGKLRVAVEPFLPARPPDGDESLGSFVRRRFGVEALERIVQPLVGGIYTADPERLSLAATLPRFLDMEREHGSVIRELRRKAAADASPADSGARYGLFASLREGMTALQQALAERIRSGGEIRTSCPVTRLHIREETPDRRRFELQVASGDACSCDAALLAVPAHRAADLVADWRPDLAGTLREIEYASSVVVVTGHREEDVAHPLNAAGLVIPVIENREVLAVSFLSRKFPQRAPEGRVVLRTFVGGAMQPELPSRSDEELAALVRGELRELLGVTGEPDVIHVVRWERAMPQYHVGHLDRVAAIERQCTPLRGFALAGNAYRGVGLPDCIRDGEQAAARIWNDLFDVQRGAASDRAPRRTAP